MDNAPEGNNDMGAPATDENTDGAEAQPMNDENTNEGGEENTDQPA